MAAGHVNKVLTSYDHWPDYITPMDPYMTPPLFPEQTISIENKIFVGYF